MTVPARIQNPGPVKRLLSNLGVKYFGTTANPSEAMLEWFKGTMPGTKNTQVALNSFYGWTFACVDLISQRVASIDYILSGRKVTNGKEILVPQPDHIFYETIWKMPNPMFSRWEMMYLLSAHLNLAGVGYWYMTLNNFGRPESVWPLMPSAVEKKVAANGSVSYRYNAAKGMIDLDPKLVLEFKRPHVNNMHSGWSPLKAAGINYDTARLIDEYQWTCFKNGGYFHYALKTKQQLNKTQADQIQFSWLAHFGKIKDSFKPPVLHSGVEAVSGPSPLDLDLGNLDDRQRDKILGAYRVPKSKLGFSESANKASMWAADAAFQQEVIKPTLTLVDSVFDLKLLPLYDSRLVGNFENPVPTDKESLREDVDMLLNRGAISVEEARERYGFDREVPPGDTVLIPFNLVPVGDSAKSVKTVKSGST